MKIVIAPDSYKESLSALEVAEEIEAGFREVLPDAEYLKFLWRMAARARLPLWLHLLEVHSWNRM